MFIFNLFVGFWCNLLLTSKFAKMQCFLCSSELNPLLDITDYCTYIIYKTFSKYSILEATLKYLTVAHETYFSYLKNSSWVFTFILYILSQWFPSGGILSPKGTKWTFQGVCKRQQISYAFVSHSRKFQNICKTYEKL